MDYSNAFAEYKALFAVFITLLVYVRTLLTFALNEIMKLFQIYGRPFEPLRNVLVDFSFNPPEP